MWSKRKAINEANNAISEYESQAASYMAETQTIGKELNQFATEYQQAQLELIDKLMGETVTEFSLTDLGQTWGVDLGGMYGTLLSQKADNLAERDELKMNEVVQDRYGLLESDSATLVLNVKDAQSAESVEEESLRQYNSQAFQWLYGCKCHELKSENGFRKFWNVITLKARKEKKYKAVVSEQFNQTPLRSIVDQYVANNKRLKKAQARVAEAMSAKNEASELIKRFDELNAWEFNFEGIVREEARGLFMKHFKSLSVDSIVARAPMEARVKAAKLHALAKKHEYASHLQTYLKTEIDDRQQRVASISRVRSKWRRNPNGSVRGDKSKWLQAIPAMKREGTRKRLGWSQKMRSSLSGYNDYEIYGIYYYSSSMHHHGFLAYDVFNQHTQARMPHESFSSEVLPEIEQFREEHSSADWLDGVVHDEVIDLPNELDITDGADVGDVGEFSDDIHGDVGAEVTAADGIDMEEMDGEIEAIESMIDDEADATDMNVDDES